MNYREESLRRQRQRREKSVPAGRGAPRCPIYEAQRKEITAAVYGYQADCGGK